MTIDYSTWTKEDLLKEKHRLENEISMYNNFQMGIKILINSIFGALGNEDFLYFLVDNAESITTTGQVVNLWTSKRTNELLNQLTGIEKDRVVYNDTDSAFFNLSDIVSLLDVDESDYDAVADALHEFEQEIIQPEIQSYTDELCDYLNNYENKMVWEREVISPSTIMVAKKRYVMLVKDSEGVRYHEPSMKITGLESKKSSTPEWAKKPLEHVYKLVLYDKKNEMYEYINGLKEKFMALDANEIAQPTGVNGIEKYSTNDGGYTKGTPRHVKGAINHNRLIKQLDLKHIPPIQSGANIKILSLKSPNPLGDDVIGFEGRLPVEFGLESYVNRDVAYERGFEKPLQNFLNALGWTTTQTISLF